jgi:hypothetical protein
MQRLSENSLNRLYADIFSKIFTTESFTRSIAMRTFSFLLCMQETLSSTTFLTAIARTNSNCQAELKLSDLLKICFNMIVLDSKLNILRFAHVSIQEFLETQPDLTTHHAHELAAMSCHDMCMKGLPVGLKVDLCSAERFYHYSALY